MEVEKGYRAFQINDGYDRILQCYLMKLTLFLNFVFVCSNMYKYTVIVLWCRVGR
jgi:hypothetical protein